MVVAQRAPFPALRDESKRRLRKGLVKSSIAWPFSRIVFSQPTKHKQLAWPPTTIGQADYTHYNRFLLFWLSPDHHPLLISLKSLFTNSLHWINYWATIVTSNSTVPVVTFHRTVHLAYCCSCSINTERSFSSCSPPIITFCVLTVICCEIELRSVAFVFRAPCCWYQWCASPHTVRLNAVG